MMFIYQKLHGSHMDIKISYGSLQAFFTDFWKSNVINAYHQEILVLLKYLQNIFAEHVILVN